MSSSARPPVTVPSTALTSTCSPGSSFAVSVGSSVRQGELIGTVGATGLATGPHLDFRVYREGHPIDPLKIEMPPAEPIDNDAILEFMEVSERQKEQLDSLERANKKQMEEEL